MMYENLHLVYNGYLFLELKLSAYFNQQYNDETFLV